MVRKLVRWYVLVSVLGVGVALRHGFKIVLSRQSPVIGLSFELLLVLGLGIELLLVLPGRVPLHGPVGIWV